MSRRDAIAMDRFTNGQSCSKGFASIRLPADEYGLGLNQVCAFTQVLLVLATLMHPLGAQESKSVRTDRINGTPNEKRPDLLCADPKRCQLQFQNEQMRVLRLTLGGNESLPVRDAPDTLVVCIGKCHLRLERPGGQIHDVHLDSGETRWISSYKRREINLSTDEMTVVLVEAKSSHANANPR